MIPNNVIITERFNQNLTNSQKYNKLSRFRWYGYKEGFSPLLVEEAIETIGIKNGDYILDPFNGNGTVTLTASFNNIKSIGLEVNPFVSFMSEIKQSNVDFKIFRKHISSILLSVKRRKESNLLYSSTFSELTGKPKWLFNSSVLNSFEGGWYAANKLQKEVRGLFQLALIGAAIDNCNATKDGKCLKYRENWRQREFNDINFRDSLEKRLIIISEDLKDSYVPQKAVIKNVDSRIAISNIATEFKLCITSPPYLNSFDYTDIYRPELFLGKFISNNSELSKLRFKTIRSHVEIKLPKPQVNDFGEIYNQIIQPIRSSASLWNYQIPLMIQSYFEDMRRVLIDLRTKVSKGGQLWLVVANSVYCETEVPVDLILADIGTRNGWKLKKIEVLRNIQRRKTKHNGNINSIRESLIVFME